MRKMIGSSCVPDKTNCGFTSVSGITQLSYQLPDNSVLDLPGIVQLSNFNIANGYNRFDGCQGNGFCCSHTNTGLINTITDSHSCVINKYGWGYQSCYISGGTGQTICNWITGNCDCGGPIITTVKVAVPKATIMLPNGQSFIWTFLDKTAHPQVGNGTVYSDSNVQVALSNTCWCSAEGYDTAGPSILSIDIKGYNVDITYEQTTPTALIGENVAINYHIKNNGGLTLTNAIFTGHWTYSTAFGIETKAYSATIPSIAPGATADGSIEIPTTQPTSLTFTFDTVTFNYPVPNGLYHNTGWSGSAIETTSLTMDLPVNSIEIRPKIALNQNELLCIESFGGGSTISKYSTRYPVVQFPRLTPAIITDATDNSVSTSKAIYDTLDSGAVVQVPYNQTWTLFYVILNNYQLPTICDVVDVKTGLCAKIQPGVVYACSQGQFNPALGLCVIQPESITICPEGGRFDVAQGVCIWNPPLQAVCPIGSIYDVNAKMCYFYPNASYVCPTGTTYNSAQGLCIGNPATSYVCPTGSTYNATSGKCEYKPNASYICPTGTTYNPTQGLCIGNPATNYTCPTGAIYNATTGNCEFRPQSQTVCGTGYTYNATTSRCEIYPIKTVVCPGSYAYDQASDRCVKYPDSREVCPTSSVYNATTGNCEYHPLISYVCNNNFNYNATTGNCEYRPALQTICDSIATYDPVRGLCIRILPSTPICEKGILTPDMTMCIYSPTFQIQCPQGSTYDSVADMCLYKPSTAYVCPTGSAYNATSGFCQFPVQINCPQGTYDPVRNGCVVIPNLQYLCIDGTLMTDSTGMKYCQIVPSTMIYCPTGYAYNSTQDLCVKSPNWIEPTPVIICPTGSTYNPATNKCEYNPATSYICNVGATYNAATGNCEYHPSNVNVCNSGYTYNAGTGNCEYHPPNINVCSSGFIYNSATGNCEFTPISEIVCPDGFTYNTATQKCVRAADNVITCPIGFTYNPTTDVCLQNPVTVTSDYLKMIKDFLLTFLPADWVQLMIDYWYIVVLIIIILIVLILRR